MYTHRSSRRGQRLRVFIAAAWSATIGVLTVADVRAANLRSPFETDPVAIPIEAGVSELDLNAGQTPVVAATSSEPVPLIQPDGAETGDTRGGFTPDCRDTGDYITTFAFSNVFRANIYSVNRDRVLKEFSMKLNVAQTGRTLYFYVYHRNIMTGKYERDLELPRTFSSSGLAYYSSGPITVSMPTAPGRFYLIGVAWASPSVTFGLDTVTYPVTVPFGTIEGNSGLNSPPPLATPLTVSLNRNGAYGQRLCFDPLPGACCEGSSCSVVQRSDCQGQFSEEGNTCDDITCPLEIGACCFPPTEQCGTGTSFQCAEFDGTWLGTVNTSGLPDMVADCDNNRTIDLADYACFLDCSTNGSPPPTCLNEFDYPPSDGAINLFDFASFQADFGNLQALPDQCSPNPCALARGACCKLDGFCSDGLTVEECIACPSAIWRGADTLCLDLDPPCEIRGACCGAQGVCLEKTQTECIPETWCQGLTCNDINDDCDSGPGGSCPQVGACCLDNGGCTEGITQITCEETNSGVFQGVTTHCCDTLCAQPEACCNSNGTCTEQLTATCLENGGVPQGVDTTCATVACPATQACCSSNGYCAELTPDSCLANGGQPQSPGSDCTPNVCPAAPRGCCLPSGGCLVLTPSDCATAQGVLRGPGSNCATPCDGACCLPGGGCLDLSETDCVEEAEGTWQAAESCATFTCP